MDASNCCRAWPHCDRDVADPDVQVLAGVACRQASQCHAADLDRTGWASRNQLAGGRWRAAWTGSDDHGGRHVWATMGSTAVWGHSARHGENPMTSTTRWAIAQRRKRLIINQTLRERAQEDPRRRHTDLVRPDNLPRSI